MDMEVDVLIVGTGVAGLYAALNLRRDLNILLVTKSSLKESNSSLAQGGISTARGFDDIPLFIEDTLRAGKYKNDIASVRILAEESMPIINSILEAGVDLDTNEHGLCYTKEGAHSINRIVHSRDKTGAVVIDALCIEAARRMNITIYEDSYIADLITDNNNCLGGILFKDNKQINIFSKVTILATGGIGGIFKNSTNRRHITGDGIALAVKNNIRLGNLDYIQFHPTALYEKDTNKRRFLISESVRGEGGILTNSKGERFIDELLPRDVVTAAILKEIRSSRVPYVNLDISFKDKNYTVSRFPTIYRECLLRGIDITTGPIPVSPAQHYFMGGIEVDKQSKTSMENLFAIGEVSCTGVHGANRLASNSLLEGLVFSKRAAQAINNYIDNINCSIIPIGKVEKDIVSKQKENMKITIEEFRKSILDEDYCGYDNNRRSWDLNDELVNY